jgi:hypothetical protein
MPQSALSAVPRQPAAGVNRRLTIRHGGDLGTQVNAANDQLSAFQKVRVHDISQGGVALILPHAPTVGTTIFLQMTNRHLEFTYDLAAEVRHTTPHQRGSWLVGLAFEQALSADDLVGLI